MSDIVERLKARSFRLAARDLNGDGAKLALDAADEITRLQARVAELEGVLLAISKGMTHAVVDAGAIAAQCSITADTCSQALKGGA